MFQKESLLVPFFLFAFASTLHPMNRETGSSSHSIAQRDEAHIDRDVDELKEAFGELTLDEEAHQPCHICYDPFFTTEGNTCQTTLLCGHTFHDSCIRQWTANNATCPVCRNPHANLWLAAHDAVAALRRGNAEAPDRAIQALRKIYQVAQDLVKEASGAASAEADRRAIRKMLRRIIGFIHNNQFLLNQHGDDIGSWAAGALAEAVQSNEDIASESLSILSNCLPLMPRANYYTLGQLIRCTAGAERKAPRRLTDRALQQLLPAVRSALKEGPRDDVDRPAYYKACGFVWEQLADLIGCLGNVEFLLDFFVEGLIQRCALDAFTGGPADTIWLIQERLSHFLTAVATTPKGADHVMQLFSQEGAQRILATKLSLPAPNIDYAIQANIWACFSWLFYHAVAQPHQSQEVWELLERCKAPQAIAQALKRPVTEHTARLQDNVLLCLSNAAAASRDVVCRCCGTDYIRTRGDHPAVAIWQILKQGDLLPDLFQRLMQPTNNLNARIQQRLWNCLAHLAWADYEIAQEMGRLLRRNDVNPTYEDEAITAAMTKCRRTIARWKSWCTCTLL